MHHPSRRRPKNSARNRPVVGRRALDGQVPVRSAWVRSRQCHHRMWCSRLRGPPFHRQCLQCRRERASLHLSSGSNKNLGILFEQTMSHVEEIAEDSVVEMISVRRDANDELREMADQKMSLIDQEMSVGRRRVEVVVPDTASEIQQPKPGWRTY